MAIFLRPAEAPKVRGKRYTRFRSAVRSAFSECCAYCLLHELLAGGPDNFELDHFCPKSLSQFAHLVHDFFNLFYACHPCNNKKGNQTPAEAGMRLLGRARRPTRKMCHTSLELSSSMHTVLCAAVERSYRLRSFRS